MKYLVPCWVLLAVAFALAGQHSSVSPLVSMVRTEQAFAKASHDQGTREAFMQFIADDGILFRPKAVLGKQWLQEHPVPSSPKRPLLAWQPVFAVVSSAGDMGYTTGPWEFKSDISDATPSGYGEFITVWKKQADGTWKFAIDLGISHPQSAGPLKIWEVSDSKRPHRPVFVDTDVARESLLSREKQFTEVATRETPPVAFDRFGASDIRLFREGHFPFIGKQASKRAFVGKNEIITWTRAGDHVSKSGDLGYVYGTYQTAQSADGTKTAAREGNFLRIWQTHGNNWVIVLDVASPLQQ